MTPWSDHRPYAQDHRHQRQALRGSECQTRAARVSRLEWDLWNAGDPKQHWPADLHTFDYDSPAFQARLQRLVAKLGKGLDEINVIHPSSGNKIDFILTIGRLDQANTRRVAICATTRQQIPRGVDSQTLNHRVLEDGGRLGTVGKTPNLSTRLAPRKTDAEPLAGLEGEPVRKQVRHFPIRAQVPQRAETIKPACEREACIAGEGHFVHGAHRGPFVIDHGTSFVQIPQPHLQVIGGGQHVLIFGAEREQLDRSFVSLPSELQFLCGQIQNGQVPAFQSHDQEFSCGAESDGDRPIAIGIDLLLRRGRGSTS